MKANETIFILEGKQGLEAYGSIAAIFDNHTPEDLGVSNIRDVWGSVDPGSPLDTGKVKIHRLTIKRRRQKK